MKPPENNTIALIVILASVALSIFLFAESRNDPSLRIAALVSCTGSVTALLAIGSTILTGKDVTKKDTVSTEVQNPTQVTTTTTKES